MSTGTSRRSLRRLLLDGTFDWRIAFEVFEESMSRTTGDAGWYGLRADGRVAPITSLGRRLLGLHLVTTTAKD